MKSTPDAIATYYAAAGSGDTETVVSCFTADARVRDDGHDYRGHDQIRAWRDGLASAFTYTTEITGIETVSETEFAVLTHLEGNFPGGVVDLRQQFTLSRGLIDQLVI